MCRRYYHNTASKRGNRFVHRHQSSTQWLLRGTTEHNTRKQTPVEFVDTFIQDLYRIAEDCEYGTLKDQLIRDRTVVGVLDDTLSDRLQAKSDLTLADAVRMSCQAEARKQNCTVI